jgi:CheY-like chemotaxis protein
VSGLATPGDGAEAWHGAVAEPGTESAPAVADVPDGAGHHRAAAPTVTGAAALPPPDLGGILLIEDEPSAARLLRAYLEAGGYRVRLATTGEDGLAAACRERPDAVILDVLLPGIDGWEVLRLLKHDPQLAGVPVFVASVVDERDAGLSLGAADFFVKPIDRQRLLARVAEVLLEPGAAGDRTRPLARAQPFDRVVDDLLRSDIDAASQRGGANRAPTTGKVPVPQDWGM